MNENRNQQLESGFASRSLADIAISLPGATALFRRKKLDFCCGGTALLGEAALAKQLDLAELIVELQAIAETAEPAEIPADTDTLIDRIEARYHQVHRRELPELIRMARRVEAVHRGHTSVPAGLANLLQQVADELESHMQKEEQVLFPLMRRGNNPAISEPIAVILGEHDHHGEQLRAIEALTGDFFLPENACTTWRALYAGTAKFVNDVMKHIHTENHKLFPRFAA